jgi:hypothetical protein
MVGDGDYIVMKPPATRNTEPRTYCTACAKAAASDINSTIWLVLVVLLALALLTLVRFLT